MPVDIKDLTATFHWQTNGMGDVYWDKPCDITAPDRVMATFAPTNDFGASLYSWYIGIRSGKPCPPRKKGRRKSMSS